MQESFLTFLGDNLQTFLTYTGVYNATPGHLVMILIGLLFIFLAIKYKYEHMLLIPIYLFLKVIMLQNCVLSFLLRHMKVILLICRLSETRVLLQEV